MLNVEYWVSGRDDFRHMYRRPSQKTIKFSQFVSNVRSMYVSAFRVVTHFYSLYGMRLRQTLYCY